MRSSSTAVHPRPRGEHCAVRSFASTPIGSSPPARGTHRGHTSASVPLRFIPARAGNTTPRRSRRFASPVHPRPRGEHNHVVNSAVGGTGSSPPARGTLHRFAHAQDVNRFIPARAGNTRLTRPPRPLESVHPRPRGEHHCPRKRSRNKSGSSPPAREHISTASSFVYPIGSSPPARGTRERALDHAVAERFIPARAGNTHRRSRPARRTPVHPRPRGEHPA